MGKRIDPSKISQEIADGSAILVDVRGDDEWAASHATGAVHLPVDRILEGKLPTEDRAIKLYIYCASGGRAGRAASRLSNDGFEAENIGGLSGWKSSGGTIDY